MSGVATLTRRFPRRNWMSNAIPTLGATDPSDSSPAHSIGKTTAIATSATSISRQDEINKRL